MRLNFHSIHSIAFAGVLVFAPIAASAATCGGDYGAWLQGVKQEATSRGIGARGLAALGGVTPDPAVISHDRGQGVFRQTFEQFGPHRVNPLLNLGANRLRSLAVSWT
jgi:membrane-bound lytic murein transglycosylase B